MAAALATAPAPRWYRFGDGYLELASYEPEFALRFDDLYRECRDDDPPPGAPTLLRCAVTLDGPGQVAVRYDDDLDLDPHSVATSALNAYGLEDCGGDAGGRRLRDAAGRTLLLLPRGLKAHEDAPWKGIAAGVAVHRVLRAQRHMLFFHSGAVAIGGRGALLMGPREAGKTTLSLALADRGHAFYADEIAGVNRRTLELVAVRRRVAIRPGPAAEGIRRRLAAGNYQPVLLEDGNRRTRLHPADFFPSPNPGAVTAAIFFLRERSAGPARAERFAPGPGDIRLLSPFDSAMWGPTAGADVMAQLRLLIAVRCYRLHAGGVEETAALVERLMLEDDA